MICGQDRRRRGSRYLLAIVVTAGFLLLAGTGCDLEDVFGGSLNQEVKSAYGVDINDPTEMVGAAVTARTLGDTTKADGLDALRGVRRADYEQKGDKLLAGGDYKGAIDKYQQALNWNEPPPKKNSGGILDSVLDTAASVGGKGDPAMSARLHSSTCEAYEKLGDRDQATRSCRSAGRAYEEAAQGPSATGQRSRDFLSNAADAYYRGYDKNNACRVARSNPDIWANYKSFCGQ